MSEWWMNAQGQVLCLEWVDEDIDLRKKGFVPLPDPEEGVRMFVDVSAIGGDRTDTSGHTYIPIRATRFGHDELIWLSESAISSAQLLEILNSKRQAREKHGDS